MATVREGHRSVLLVVDVQVGVMRQAWSAGPVIEKVVQAVERARRHGTPVIWVQHDDEEMPRDGDAWQLVFALQPAPGEARFYKQYNSAFEGTALEDELARLGATHVVLAGAATNACIRATAYAALDRGYDLTLVADAHATHDIDKGNGERIAAADIVEELNIAMRWVRYPGRSNRAVPAADVEFG